MSDFYALTFSDIPLATVKGQYTTVAALIVPDASGRMCWLHRLSIGFADDPPATRNVALRLARIADLSAGSAGTSVDTVPGASMARADPGSVASAISGARDYSVEPTAYEAEPLWRIDLLTEGGFALEWREIHRAPAARQGMLLGLLAAPRTAGAPAVHLSGTLEFEAI